MKTVQYAGISGIPGVSADWRAGVALSGRAITITENMEDWRKWVLME